MDNFGNFEKKKKNCIEGCRQQYIEFQIFICLRNILIMHTFGFD